MENFFGLESCSSNYDSRRHINLIYFTFFQYRLLADGQKFIQSFASVFQTRNEQSMLDFTVNNIFCASELAFLNYLKNRYNLSDMEYNKILSGITHHNTHIKSPAGYSTSDNWRLIIHMLYAQLCVEPKYHKYDIQIQIDCIIKMAQGMRGISIDNSKWQLVVNSLNDCLDKDWRKFTDLPRIEQYILSKLGL